MGALVTTTAGPNPASHQSNDAQTERPMDRAGRVAISIVTGFIVAVIIASCLVVTVAEHQRADKATSRAERAEGKLAVTQDDLVATQDELTYTSGNLESVSYEVTKVSQTLNSTKGQVDTLAAQNRACRYLIRVNDRLVLAMTSQQKATSHLMHQHKRYAARWLRRAARQVRAVQTIVTRSGHRTIDELIGDCAPKS
jgi:hypothetical protein